MGRKTLDPEKRETDYYTVKIKDKSLMKEIHTIMAREGKNLSETFTWALSEFNDRHGPGNTQTVLAAFAPGGLKSMGQLETEIYRLIEKLPQVKWFRILELVDQYTGLRGKEKVAAAERVSKKYRDEGGQVSR